MATISEQLRQTRTAGGGGVRVRLQELLPRVVLAPSFAAVLIFVYGFILFTAYLSFTNSKILPSLQACCRRRSRSCKSVGRVFRHDVRAMGLCV
jgi:ABC-type sugar transport system permease subunit